MRALFAEALQRFREVVFGEALRGRDELAPRTRSESFVHRVESGHESRHRRRLRAGERTAGGTFRRGRRGFAKIERPDAAGFGVVVRQESAAAEARRFRLEHRQRERNGDRRVDRIAAVAQNAQADLRRGGRRCGERGVGGGDLRTGENVA